MHKLFSFILLTGLCLGVGTSMAEAQSTITCGSSSLSNTANIQYDPSSPADTIAQIRVYSWEARVHPNSNRGSLCISSFMSQFYTWDADGGAVPKLGDLEYEILTPNGNNIAYGQQPLGAPPQFLLTSSENGGDFYTLTLKIPAGQSVAPGLHSDNVLFFTEQDRRYCQNSSYDYRRRYRYYSNCGPIVREQFSRGGNFTVNVVNTLSINIAGAATTRTFDFGPLEQGERQSVNIQTRSNSPYQISFDSDMDGTMKLGGDKDAVMEIAYTATLDGQLITEGAPYRNSSVDGTNGQDVNLPFEVTIGDTSNKRAGHYSDIIKLKIENIL